MMACFAAAFVVADAAVRVAAVAACFVAGHHGYRGSAAVFVVRVVVVGGRCLVAAPCYYRGG